MPTSVNVKKGCLLGIDIGTYESKGALVSPDGEVLCTHSVPHRMIIPRQGWAEHDAEKSWWGDFCAITRALLQKARIDASEVLSVGCSTIGPCVVPIDKEGIPLRNAILYGIDTRAVDEIAELNRRFGADELFRRTGNALSAQSIGPKILWLKHHEPEIYAKAHKFVTGATYLVGRLTGRWVIDKYTASCWGPLFDPETMDWAEDLCEGIVERQRLADHDWTDAVAGTVTPEAAKSTGLATGTPVIVGTTDASAEGVSVGGVLPGYAMLMYGSTMFYIQMTDSPVRDGRLWSAPYLFPDTYAVMAGMATTGALTRWFRDQLAQDLNPAEDGDNAYTALTREAASIPPGSEGLVALPYFSGERTPLNDPLARGVFFGLTLAHTRAHMYRAILESVGHGIRHHLDLIGSLGHMPTKLLGVGGGTKNKPWLQMVSDISGVPQEIPSVTFGASYGDAFLAGLGIGLFESPRDIFRWIKEVETITPVVERKALYDKYHRIYLELYNRNSDLMHELSSMVR